MLAPKKMFPRFCFVFPNLHSFIVFFFKLHIITFCHLFSFDIVHLQFLFLLSHFSIFIFCFVFIVHKMGDCGMFPNHFVFVGFIVITFTCLFDAMTLCTHGFDHSNKQTNQKHTHKYTYIHKQTVQPIRIGILKLRVEDAAQVNDASHFSDGIREICQFRFFA